MKAAYFFLSIALASTISAAELHVSVAGKDTNPGLYAASLRTIQRAAELAQPGDTITVHAGVYREQIAPPRGGTSDQQRIVFQAAPGEKVEIKGSEVVKDWKPDGNAWKAIVPNELFGEFNPYSDLIRGDWFDRKGRDHHTGAVYLDGEALDEAASLEDLRKAADERLLWFAEVGEKQTSIWARFQGVDPNARTVEINVRRAVFYPAKPGVNYITVRGFTMRHAATNWAPPTAEQVGLIGTHWSKGWIIEHNTISHSRCSGITLGKYGDEWDNTSQNRAEGYVKTIERATANGWNQQNIGGHIVRHNAISDCEQTGICGSLGAIFSTIHDNHIERIWTRRLFAGAEIAGIKLHGAIDVTIRRNRIHNAGRGLWMDWMAHGTRITGNLCYDNSSQDFFTEVNHGPTLIDNNLFLSKVSVLDMSQGGAYVHNLFAGRIIFRPELRRLTPYHPPHSTVVKGMSKTPGGDDRFLNNIFAGGADVGLAVYDRAPEPLVTGGNVYYSAARPYGKEVSPTTRPDHDPKLKLLDEGATVRLQLTIDDALTGAATSPVTTERLGKAKVSDLPYENADGAPLTIDTDYFGAKRDPARPTPGPFEKPATGSQTLKVW